MSFIDTIRIKPCVVSIFLMISAMIIISYRTTSPNPPLTIDEIIAIIDEKPFERLPSSSFLYLNQTLTKIAAIDQIYLINLPTRLDRRTTSIALFQTLHLTVHIFSALTISSPEVRSRLHHLHRHRITQIELACWASHLQLWTHIALTSSMNDSWSLIFEDDVDLEMSMVEVIESFPKEMWTRADMLYLGYCGNPRGELLFRGMDGYQVHRAINPSCTHAYAIRTGSISKLVYLLSFPDRAIDDEIVRLSKAGSISVLSIHPPLAIQRSVGRWNPSDVNPIKNRWIYPIKEKIDRLVQWWQQVEQITSLKNSTLAHADLIAANRWRTEHETHN